MLSLNEVMKCISLYVSTILGQNPPGQILPDKTPRSIPPWTKPPRGQTPPRQNSLPKPPYQNSPTKNPLPKPPTPEPPDKTHRTKPHYQNPLNKTHRTKVPLPKLPYQTTLFFSVGGGGGCEGFWLGGRFCSGNF